MTIINQIVGGSTDTSARFIVRSDQAEVQLAISASPEMFDADVFSPSPVISGRATINIGNLTPNMRYYWVTNDGQDTSPVGTFVTHPVPGEPDSFTFGAAGDAGLNPQYPGIVGNELEAIRVSNSPLYGVMRQRALLRNWLFFVNLGDWGYPDWGSRTPDNVTNRRRFYDDNLNQPNQAAFCRDCAQVYFWDDHCYGDNDSTLHHAGKHNALQVYKERFPHYPLSNPSNGIYQAWQVARTLFIGSDVRFNKSSKSTPDAQKTVLGAQQKQWMEQQLLAARDNDGIEAVIWLMPGQWMSTGSDAWGSALTERAELVQMFGDTGWLGKMAMLSADAHDTFIHSEKDYRNLGYVMKSHFPVFHFASIDATGISGPPSDVPSGKNSLANNHRGRGQFGSLTISDHGGKISISGTGFRGATPVNRYQYTTR